MNQKAYIFLDFDGVLHAVPTRRDGLFFALPVFWNLLDALPEAMVVISSSWREHYSLDVLIDMFTANGGEHFRDRIIGITPSLGEPEVIRQGERQDEIEAWIASNTSGPVRYAILDDIPDFFHSGCPRLYLTDFETGLVDNDIPKILEILREEP